IRGSDQGDDGGRSRHRLATHSQGAGMSSVGTPSENTAVETPSPEAKDSSHGTASVREISVAHSPDSDDAFMFYALATNKVRVPGLRFTHTLCDIETLNQKARVGDGYGPMIVAPRAYSESEIKTKRIAIPGKLTTAYLALQLFAPGVETVT